MNKKNIIVIMGGGLRRDASGEWHTTNFSEKGITGRVEGGHLRVIAAYYLYKKNPDVLLISSGGVGKYKNIPGVIPVAEVMTNELLKLGVREKDILAENESNHTFGQLKELARIIKEFDLEKIIIISNKYHLPRIRAMIENVSSLKDMKKLFINCLIELKSAEDIVLEFEPRKWKNIIESAYDSKDMKKRIKSEEAGVEQIKNGTYKIW